MPIKRARKAETHLAASCNHTAKTARNWRDGTTRARQAERQARIHLPVVTQQPKQSADVGRLDLSPVMLRERFQTILAALVAADLAFYGGGLLGVSRFGSVTRYEFAPGFRHRPAAGGRAAAERAHAPGAGVRGSGSVARRIAKGRGNCWLLKPDAKPGADYTLCPRASTPRSSTPHKTPNAPSSKRTMAAKGPSSWQKTAHEGSNNSPGCRAKTRPRWPSCCWTSAVSSLVSSGAARCSNHRVRPVSVAADDDKAAYSEPALSFWTV